jgi:hypothetical protein
LLLVGAIMDAPGSTRLGLRRALVIALAVAATQGIACFVSLDGLTGGSSEGGVGAVAPPTGPSAGFGATGAGEDAGVASEDAGIAVDPPETSGIDATAAPDATSGTGAPSVDAGVGSGGAALLVFGAPATSSPPIGGDSGTPFSESCPSGAALVGLALVVDTDSPFPLLQVGALCSAIGVTSAGILTFSSPAPLTLQGDANDAEVAANLLCPVGSVVVGLAATAQKYVHAIALACQPLVTVPASDTGFTIGLGALTQVGPFGGTGGDPTPAFQCPAPSVANAIAGTAGGDGYLDSIVLGCATPSSR